jgi:hypothetical protein
MTMRIMDAQTRASLIALETELLRAEVRADSARLAILLDDAFEEIGASGRTFGKVDVLQRLPSEHAPDFQPQDFVARWLAEGLAQLCYRLVMVRQQAEPAHSLRSSLWRQTGDGNWRMVFHQGTPSWPPVDRS